MPSEPSPSPTTPRSPRRTHWSVLAADRAARVVISVGGLLVIGAVLLVCVFLTLVVIPLFRGSSLGEETSLVIARGQRQARTLKVDEYGALAWTLGHDWTVRLFRPDTGETIATYGPFKDASPTAYAIDDATDKVVFGFADGTIRQGSFAFESEILTGADVPRRAQNLPPGDRVVVDDRLLEGLEPGKVRSQRLVVTLNAPVAVAEHQIRLLDESQLSNGYAIAALAVDGTLLVKTATTRTNLMTGEETTRLSGGELKVEMPSGLGDPAHIMVTGNGDCVFLVWQDGTTFRYDTRNINEPVLAESIDLVEPSGGTVSAITFLLGRSSLLVGESTGDVSLWFRTKPANADTVDGVKMRMTRKFAGDGSPVTAIGPAPRKRVIAMASQKGMLRVYYTTNGKRLATTSTGGSVVDRLVIAPKGEAIVGMAGGTLLSWPFDSEHPESSWNALFSEVWYEGYTEPQLVWQSSSGTDDFEPKLSLVPLIFGTIKATVYCMIFGLPVAVLAAIYTSEFMPRRARATVKPMIEMMASLPSVVLGFLAAIIFAPFIEDIVPATLAAILLVPLSLVLGACLWQLLPRRFTIRYMSWRPWAMGLMSVGAIGVAAVVGPLVEHAIFAGDLKAWLSGGVGGAAPGWMVLLAPLCIGGGLLCRSRMLEAWARKPGDPPGRRRIALLDLLIYVAAVVIGLGLAYLMGLALGASGLDLRGTVVGRYEQRNALVVGFVMGFAVIPIIYTVAEDALNAVPEHLRAASLGAGATPWQTAWRVIVPTAMSGLFSAAMIGFGRAVGETMIVLMAAGNTAIMDWNVFEGFRTLSANIATELPEAVQGSTHYRMLFLAALMLFILTFLVNTIAEIVRQRFRKRAFQL